MLVKKACETEGEVKDCSEVVAASNKYRQSQDCIAGFIADNIEKVHGAHVGKKLLNSVFKEWFQLNYSGRKIPKLTELEEAMDKKYLELIEGYRDFKKGDVKPSHTVKNTIKEIAKKLQEIETLVHYNSRLKNEAGIASSEYGPAASKALAKISERLVKISERIRSLGE